jgi:hypothetical protein
MTMTMLRLQQQQQQCRGYDNNDTHTDDDGHMAAGMTMTTCGLGCLGLIDRQHSTFS